MSDLTRNAYHPDVVAAEQMGVLSARLRALIPKSTLHGFRSRDLSDLITLEEQHILRLAKDLQSLNALKLANSVMSAILRVAHFVKSLDVSFRSVSRVKNPEIRVKIVAFVLRLSGTIPKANILSFLGLTRARFASWRRNAVSCLSSPLSRCRRSYPNQLTKTEVRAIKSAFSDPADYHLPAFSVAWKLINSEEVSANVATIAGYAKAMKLTDARKPPHKSRKRGSYSALKPNQAWHLDVTVVTTADNLKAYVQFLIDNYSRKILAWKASLFAADINSTDLIKEAFAAIADAPKENILLIVDGGWENNNRRVEAYLQNVPITKLIAQIDVSFSNSMIEAVNKTMKYRYLFRHYISDFDHLIRFLGKAVLDFNASPHYALSGLSPDEAQAGKIFDKAVYRERLRKARENRLRENRSEHHPCISWDGQEGETVLPSRADKSE